ncbi:AraC family transcriptional regulator [Oricola nitratireducens]|uniref:AraC family transcriptional regulator n=1 Tax=Oricola nitratireducens TaxID=2775868 RepID=UPI0018668D19|nr:AraC family transcriptional regulator [Oricola nitratireducens]
MRTPLAGYSLFRSQDLDEARERVAAVFCPHRLDTIGKGLFSACQHHLPGERLSLNYIEYGAKTLIAPGELDKFYLMQIPLEGGAAIVNGGDRYFSHPGAAAVLNPHLPTTMIWEEGCRQVLVRIDRRAMQDHLATHIGASGDRPLTFSGPLDLTQGAGASLRRLVLHLVAEADEGTPSIGRGGLLGRQIEGAILTGLLEAHRHNYSGLIGFARSGPAPRHVRQAEDYMLAHLDRSLTIEEIASAVGISPRALQLGFRSFRNATPMGFLRDARLRRAHQDLIAARPDTTVTDVAIRWGFTHFGRFAEIYRNRFGCTPREALKAARGSDFGD